MPEGKREGTVVGLHEDGSQFTRWVAMTPQRSKEGMPIGFLAMSSDIVEGVRLTVELERTSADAHSTLEFLPDALVTVNTSDEIQLANAEAAILHGENRTGSGRPAVEMLIADRYLDLHPGVRIAFCPELRLHPSGARPQRSVQNQNGGANCYVHKQVEFRRCCDVVRAMRMLWLRTNPSSLTEKAGRMSNQETQSQSSGVSAVCVKGAAHGALAALIVEDSSRDVEFIVRALQKAGYTPVRWRQVVDADGMKTALVEDTWDVVVSEYRMPAFDSFKALAVLGASGVTVPLIMFTGSIHREIALAAFSAGAADVVMEDRLDELSRAVRRCLRRQDEDRRALDATVHAMHESEGCFQAPIEMLIDPFAAAETRRDKASLGDSIVGLGSFSSVGR